MSDRVNVAFVGCSLTRGDGFAMAYLAPEIWPNIISRVFNYDSRNLAITDASNLRIFQTASAAIKSKQHELIFCQWTALDRMWISPAPNVWYSLTDDKNDSFEYQNLKLDPHKKNELTCMIKMLNHDYQNIMELVDYVNVLEDLARHHQVKLVHVNGMIPWKSDLGDATVAQDFDRMSEYTKQVLDFDNRTDDQIKPLFETLHKKFITMNTKNWVNIFDAFINKCQDFAPKGQYPGIRSQVIIGNQVRSFIHKGLL